MAKRLKQIRKQIKKRVKRKASKVERMLVRLEKAIVAQALRVDRIEEFLGDDLKAFHEKQPAASLTNGPQAGALVDPE